MTYHSGSQNISQQQQSFWRLPSPGRSHQTKPLGSNHFPQVKWFLNNSHSTTALMKSNISDTNLFNLRLQFTPLCSKYLSNLRERQVTIFQPHFLTVLIQKPDVAGQGGPGGIGVSHGFSSFLAFRPSTFPFLLTKQSRWKVLSIAVCPPHNTYSVYLINHWLVDWYGWISLVLGKQIQLEQLINMVPY